MTINKPSERISKSEDDMQTNITENREQSWFLKTVLSSLAYGVLSYIFILFLSGQCHRLTKICGFFDPWIFLFLYILGPIGFFVFIYKVLRQFHCDFSLHACSHI
jgi:hypothetical protein